MTGLPFTVGLPPGAEPDHYIDIMHYDLTNFTIITASSENHFEESKDLVAGIQERFPNKTIYYYDLGLAKDQIKTVLFWIIRAVLFFSGGGLIFFPLILE
jgi:hypothetical protein